MKVLVTGASGFVGKNLVATLAQNKNFEVYCYDKENTIEDLKEFTTDCEFVVHLAGINRPTNPEDFYLGNAGFTEVLCNLLKENNNKSPILISSSIHAIQDNDYGMSKKEGEDILTQHGIINGSKVYIYRLANLFGKWCRPNYNSVVATWCHNIANNLNIQVNNPEVLLPLCYIDDVVKEFIACLNGNPLMKDDVYSVNPIYTVKLGRIKDLLASFKSSRTNLLIADMSDPFEKKLYSTYLSYLSVDDFSYPLKMNIDERGSFTEFIKTIANGQVSINKSKPGITKGNHWHHSKNEKFLVVSGVAKIQFRKVGEDKIIDYIVNGDLLEVIDIPTGYTHNIINIGESDLITVMWANESFDPNHPDTIFLKV